MILDRAAELAKLGLEVGAGAALTLSALGVPAAWPFTAKLYVHQYDPRAFWDGARRWFEAAGKVREARIRIEGLVHGVSDDGWKSEDGRLFQHRMDAFLTDLRSIEIRALVTTAVLSVTAAALNR